MKSRLPYPNLYKPNVAAHPSRSPIRSGPRGPIPPQGPPVTIPCIVRYLLEMCGPLWFPGGPQPGDSGWELHIFSQINSKFKFVHQVDGIQVV